ncbi:MAG: DUF5399 family protein [Chlamydiales bacterium]|nr:DUF5399 family protein [Chlamydiales bacterium]
MGIYIGKIPSDDILKELMADKYITIDALPQGHSRRYIERTGQTDERFIRESNFIPEKTTIAPATPYYAPHSELDYLFGSFPSFTNASTIASFTPPESLNTGACYTKTLLIPSLGSEDQIEELETKVEELKSKAETKELKIISDFLAMLKEKNGELRLFQTGFDRFKRG